MSARVVVIGAGFAGSAAAFAARRAGAQVTLVHDRAGTSELYSGAIDLFPWDAPADPAAERAALEHAALRDFRAGLGMWALGQRHVATRAGVVRRALGADAALLDLTPLAGRRIGVADIGRDDWDAPELAAALTTSDWAERTRTTFVPVAVNAVRLGHERRITPYDFAAFHDDPERLQSLARALSSPARPVDAWLLGPWLGLAPGTPPALRALVPVPVGEATSPMGGPAGARFELARTRLFAGLELETRRARVRNVSKRPGGWAVALETEPGDPLTPNRELEANAVVIATGGIAAGGIRLRWEPGHGARGFELAYEAPVLLALDHEFLVSAGSMFGPDLEHAGLSVLERVGVAAGLDTEVIGEAAGRRLFAAGDAVAGRARTVLGAVLDGLRAGALAAGEA
jgi:anaerobic glycerol-3-phosphate dehydrogenase